MSSSTGKNQNPVNDDAWQPDQAVVFNQPDQPQPTAKSQSPVKASQPLNQSSIWPNIASRLELLIQELRTIIQIINQPSLADRQTINSPTQPSDDDNKTIEGYFDGEQMVTTTGQAYAVPANYASKSKLVVGDSLKLTIGPRGRFIYKQVNPVERRRLVASLEQAPDGNYYAVHKHQRWRLLKASVSYFRAQPGDRIAIVLPRDLPANFAALENLVAE
ncbi:MAG TPA: hypothetical protein PK085_03815 [bacterium]|nr:hypothetical protein [bacterium]HQA64199.1 hypothetical protein [bacterium]